MLDVRTKLAPRDRPGSPTRVNRHSSSARYRNDSGNRNDTACDVSNAQATAESRTLTAPKLEVA